MCASCVCVCVRESVRALHVCLDGHTHTLRKKDYIHCTLCTNVIYHSALREACFPPGVSSPARGWVPAPGTATRAHTRRG